MNGSDSNSGLTAAAAKRTLAAGMALLAAGASGATLAVFPGTYTEGVSWNTAKVANIGFVGDTVLDLQGLSAPNDSGLESLAGTLNVYGPPSPYTCVVKNAGNDGISATSGNINTFDIDVQDCFDGASCHNGSTMRVYRSTITNCGKDAFAHVGTAVAYHEGCTFVGANAATNGIGVVQNTAVVDFVDCTLEPPPGATCKPFTSTSTGLTTFTRCKIGTASMTGSWTGDILGWQTVTCVDTYLRGFAFLATKDVTLTRCYGTVTMRTLAAADENVLVENCVFKTGVTSGRMLNSDFRSAPTFIGGAGIVRNSIFVSHTVAIFADATNVSDMNTNWSFLNNCFNGNGTNMTSGLTADGTDLLADPLLVDTTTDAQSGWKYAANSPCIGAGTSGGNIGIGAA